VWPATLTREKFEIVLPREIKPITGHRFRGSYYDKTKDLMASKQLLKADLSSIFVSDISVLYP
jgi:hypothetical protein